MSDQVFESFFNDVKKGQCAAFALVDPLVKVDGKAVMSRIELGGMSLLDDEGGAAIQEIGPFLVPLDHDTINNFNTTHALVRYKPCMTVLTSGLSLTDLHRHLKSFLNVRLPDKSEMLLAFWDPMILAGLIGSPNDNTLYVKGPILDKVQRDAFLAPMDNWLYWDRAGNPQTLVLNRLGEEARRLPAFPNGLTLSDNQLDLLVEASVPDNILHFLKKNQEPLVYGKDDGMLYGLIVRQLNAARSYGLRNQRDLVNFCSVAIAFGEGFERERVPLETLNALSQERLSFDDFLKHLA